MLSSPENYDMKLLVALAISTFIGVLYICSRIISSENRNDEILSIR
jgi:hypothetical protein